ncbi:GGDEF domain-containing protein [Devosia sp. FKR38]|uniref:GGDEF domain-containing protein n=1 Tax=Devosia sp. FKR38 TaxID=2562312 RepID=UPI0020BEDFBE|nr:GGDEF domain-containing protein [Devosia sp. FKR38]
MVAAMHRPNGKSIQVQKGSATGTSSLTNAVSDPDIMREAERLLGGRTRDIKFSAALERAFRDRTWRQTAKIIRSWMVWVIVLDGLTLSMNVLLLPRAQAIAMLSPGLIIPIAAVTIWWVWQERRPAWLLDGVLNVGMFLILLAVCWMGAAAGGLWQERYLYVMVFVGIAGITTFSVAMPTIWGIATSSLVLYLTFQLHNPRIGLPEALAAFFFFASGVVAVVFARRTMSVLANKAFLLELRDGARLAALTEANERLDHLAKVDPLTGVANRRWMTELLTALAGRPDHLRGSTSLLMCDIDYFKPLNDRLGHAHGDRCLVEVAAIIDQSVRSGSDHVARYGGEEFLVILPDTTAEEALVVAEQIRKNVARAALPNPGSHVATVVTISIGVAARTGDQAWSADELQVEADLALYRAKKEGRNRTVLFGAAESSKPASAAGAA